MRDLSKLARKSRLYNDGMVFFKEYGGWWEVTRVAEWLDADVEEVRRVYDRLEKEGLLDRKLK